MKGVADNMAVLAVDNLQVADRQAETVAVALASLTVVHKCHKIYTPE
jgi:hypothetical protein